jgi:hypothetical protein
MQKRLPSQMHLAKASKAKTTTALVLIIMASSTAKSVKS